METELTKRCSVCGEIKPLTAFHGRSSRPSGKTSKCKPCKAVAAAEYRSKNIEACKERSLDWYRRNKERSIATTRAWQDANKERMQEKHKQWLKRRKEEANAEGSV